ncbi:hypothetical protein K431DRAFT_291996 [Polychaeton citri CBS 116435]|uniref:Uncharacterized protein n=1 Tax=Polychaeton citri CBS 116435 TaxID=1314669 RepID=A0A9P4USW5_9PEZI|nr:hypothetical protein K431DRAFT_291996 [Polychaeton citri CBS 116435]
MEHRYPPPHAERHLPLSSYTSTFSPPTTQPPAQIPYSDPFPAGRDPFLPNGRERRLSFGRNGKAWHTPPPQQQQQIPPPPPPSQQQQQQQGQLEFLIMFCNLHTLPIREASHEETSAAAGTRACVQAQQSTPYHNTPQHIPPVLYSMAGER